MLFSPLLHTCTSISESGMMLWQALCAITVVFILESSGSIKDVQWPAGTYGIPKPVSGCPRDDGFRWQTGWRLQQMSLYYVDHSKSNNSRSPEFHIDGKVTKSKVNRSFCIKRKTSDDLMWHRPTWPRGKYCTYKKSEFGDYCPENLTSGWVFWTDYSIYEPDKYDGTLPDGDYWRSTYTKIHFCCRTDGNINDPISLPYKSPFYLLAYESAKCQMVKWAVASLEWIYYDTYGDVEGDDNWDDRNGSYPYNAGKMHPSIYYCYYQGCKKTLTAVSGTIQSPNYPKNYPNGQYCSWKIMVNITQQIHLVFKTFKLQQEKFTDELRVYDGEDDRGEILGFFYGRHPPPKEGIFSSASRMYLVFKSDGAQSFSGFSASYHAGNYKRPVYSVTTKNAQTLEMTLASSVTTATIQMSQKKSSSVFTSTTPKGTEVMLLSTVTTTTTQISDVVPSPVVTSTAAKTLKIASSSTIQASGVTLLSSVCSTSLTALTSVTHSSLITPHTLIKTTPKGKPWTPTTKGPQKKGCNETLTAISGTFQTPNYPRNYPDGEYCSWRIMVNTSQHIHLVFTSFSLQNDQNTDVVYVYDGENATGMVLGEFYGRNPPPKEGMCISSNSIFVLFKSDNVGSYPGFKASYHGVDRSELCVMTSTTAQTASVQTSQTPPVNSTAGTPKEGGKKDESKEPKKKGFNLVVVVVPVVSVALIAALLVAGICYCKRKKWKRLPGQDDAIFLRLNEESTATVENSEI